MFKHCKQNIYNIFSRISASCFVLLWMIFVMCPHFASASNAKRVAILGDSMTWIGGDSCENPKGWTYTLKKSGIADYIDIYARSGATWTNTASTQSDTGFYSEVLHDNNVIYNQAMRLIDATRGMKKVSPDVIILFAGANDAWFSDRRPGIFNDTLQSLEKEYSIETDVSTVTSLAGSVALICDILKSEYPSAIIVAVTPLQMSKVSAESVFHVSDVIEKAANSRGCMAIRADKNVGILHQQESLSPTFTSDGVHTNPTGARLLAEYILSHFNKIVKTEN